MSKRTSRRRVDIKGDRRESVERFVWSCVGFATSLSVSECISCILCDRLSASVMLSMLTFMASVIVFVVSGQLVYQEDWKPGKRAADSPQPIIAFNGIDGIEVDADETTDHINNQLTSVCFSVRKSAVSLCPTKFATVIDSFCFCEGNGSKTSNTDLLRAATRIFVRTTTAAAAAAAASAQLSKR